jgi:hypothetical protein
MSKFDPTESSPVVTIWMEDADIDLSIQVKAGVSVVYDAVESMETVLRGFGLLEKHQTLRVLTDKEFSSVVMRRAEKMLDEPLHFPPLDKEISE